MSGETTETTGLLAIDTSTERAGIAFVAESKVVSHPWPASRAQTTTVLPEIDRLIAAAGKSPADITGLVVAIGPGTFTGLRVGLAIAKGIVAAREVPLVGIPTLDIVFASHPDKDFVAVLPAGRGRVVWQERGQAPTNSTMDELIAQIDGRTLIGELSPDQETMVRAAGIVVTNEPRDPRVLLALGARRIASADLDDAVALEPTYLHGITVNAGPIEDRLRPKN